MAGNVHEFTEGNFNTEVLESKGAVLVDFWAPWCGPCRMIAPMIEELANEYQGSVKIGKLNTDDNQHLAMQYEVSSIPTLIVFKDGKVVDRFMGAQPKSRLTAAIDAAK